MAQHVYNCTVEELERYRGCHSLTFFGANLIIDLELVVEAVNRLGNTTFDHIPDWQMVLVKFFDQPRNASTTAESGARKRSIDGKLLLPEHEQNLCRTQWMEMRDELPADFGAFKAQMDVILQVFLQPTYNFTPMQLIASTSTMKQSMAPSPGYQWDHVVDLQLIVTALNRLWAHTYDAVRDWQQTLLVFFNGGANKQLLTAAKNWQKWSAVNRKLTSPHSYYPHDKKWLDLIRDKWQVLREALFGFVAFKLEMDSVMMEIGQ